MNYIEILNIFNNFYLNKTSMKTKLWKSFLAILAIATTFAFVGCTDDDPQEVADPEITISTSNLSFTQAEESKTVDVTSNGNWKVAVPEDAAWVTVNPATGRGNKSVTVTVAENTSGKSRETEISFQAIHSEWGVWDTKKLIIAQSASEQEIEETTVIYSDNFDKKETANNNGWPSADAKEGNAYVYANPQGSAAANVTYTVNGKVTVRNSGKPSNDTDYSSYEGSGVNKVFFGTLPASLIVGNIALPADKQSYELTFGANKYGYDIDNTFKNEELLVYLSKDGSSWVAVEYSFKEGVDLVGKWNLATASFKLTEVPEKLYVKIESKIASVLSIDDVALATGGEGVQTVDLSKGVSGGDEPSEPGEPGETLELTVTEAISAAKDAAVKIKESTVVAVSARSYLLTDGTSYILAYKGDDPGLVVGDKVTVEGKMGAYRSVPQIANPVATKTGHDDAFKQPEATVMDGAAIDAYAATAAGETYIKYVKVEGELIKDGYYWNLKVEGASNGQGSISYPTAEMCPDSYSGKKVAVYGYTIYQTRDKDVNIIATSIEVIGEGGGTGDEPGDEPAGAKKVTTAEFLEAAEDDTLYELTGKIANVVAGKEYYGNFDLVDDAGSVYVYGIKQNGSYGIFESLGLKEGDTITIQGNRGSWEGEPQMVNGVYISHVAGEGGNEGGNEGGDEGGTDDGNGTTVSKVMAECGWANSTAVTKLVMDENITVTFEKGSAGTAPAYYNSGMAVRLYQNGAIMNVIASNGKVIKGIELTFAKAGEIVQNFIAAAEGDLTIDGTKGSWVGEASSVKFTSTGTDKNSRAYISAIKVVYE